MNKRCSVCVMDDSFDTKISFDLKGQCNYCKDAFLRKDSTYFPNEIGQKLLKDLIYQIKQNGTGKKYDCIMGISGGLDSSYLAMLGKKWGLRVLAIHIDDGFDTDISKRNLERLVASCGFDYHIVKPDPEQFYSLTKAYMLANVANIAVPQDNILFAELYRCMKKYKMKYFLAGGNFALESILCTENTHSAYDVVNIKDISKNFNNDDIDKLSFISSIQRIIDKKLYGLKTCYPLNYIDYNRNRALKELNEFCGFEYYGSKHLENKLTAFIQLFWFPLKFHEDKRLAHYSSMIVSNQMTREEALNQLNEPLYDEKMMEDYIAEIKEKLSITNEEFTQIMQAPVRRHEDFKTEEKSIIYRLLRR